ncbi:plasmid mobilization protein [Pseudomonas fluorescens]|uniref:plasmid mobilization protein n=1 Tax=Pseudomonas fluorescens TaxID=294 RepID=UPI001240B3FF|nr:plasmid mobilization relaxosome protein MobC [Pseudomonas fluorescens]
METGKPEKPGKAKSRGVKAPTEKSVVISFRVPVSEYEPYREAVEQSALGRSGFFRQLFLENKSKVVISQKKTKTEDYTKYLHYVSKISNNINQLARLLNGGQKSGLITSKQYLNGLNTLNSIRLMLQAKFDKESQQ